MICRRYKEKKSSMTVFWFEQRGGYWDHLLSWEYWNNWKFEEKSKVHFQSCYVKVMRRAYERTLLNVNALRGRWRG